MMDKIIRITVVTKEGVGITEVGSNGIVEIKDESMEWEDGIDFIFRAYGKKGQLKKEIINCPVDIIYQCSNCGKD